MSNISNMGKGYANSLGDFSFVLPATNLFLGKGKRMRLGELSKGLGRKALVVSGKSSMRKLGFRDDAIKSLKEAGIESSVFEGVEPNPSSDTVNKGVHKGLDEGCDFVVAIGGGSVIDAAKLMAVGIGHGGGDSWQYVAGKQEIGDETLPIAALPSTSGTGSHVTWYSVISNRESGKKAACSSQFIFPRLSIVDLDIVSKMPKKLTAETGFDALAHVMEAYVSKRANPISDLLCLRAMRLIAENLERAYGIGDGESRRAMAIADSYAGICITSSRTVMVHGLGNTVSGVYPDIPHGRALACLTPPIMRYNIEKGDKFTVRKYCDIAEALGESIKGVDRKNAMKSVDAVRRLMASVGLGERLSDYGAREDEIGLMTDYSLEIGKGAISCNPVMPTREDIIAIYREAL